MEFNISGRNLTVSDRFREYAEERIAKVAQFSEKVQRLDAKVTKEASARQADTALTVELTVLGKGPVIRAEASAADKFAAFDLAFGKLLERLRRARDKRKVHHGRRTPQGVNEATATLEPASSSVPLYKATEERNGELEAAEAAGKTPAPNAEVDNGDSPVLIRQKIFPAAPMSLDDAVDNMELVGHDFYLFIDSATGRPAVVYRRRGWTYGAISLDAERSEGEPEEAVRPYRASEAATV